jgi:hypothetical protein
MNSAKDWLHILRNWHENMEILAAVKVYRTIALGLSLVSLSILTAAASPASERGATLRLPHLMLWAWERPESLRFVDSAETVVTFLAESIYLDERPSLGPRGMAQAPSLGAATVR